jgi:hypothetical protein
LHGFQTAAVKVEEMGDLVIGLSGRGRGEAGGAGGGAPESSRSGDEFEQVQSDVFVTAGADGGYGKCGCIHEKASIGDASRAWEGLAAAGMNGRKFHGLMTGQDVVDGEVDGDEDAVESGEREGTFGVEEVGDVGLTETGEAGEFAAGEKAEVEAAEYLQTESFVQVAETHDSSNSLLAK